VNKHIASWYLALFAKSVGVAAAKGRRSRWMRHGGGWWGFRGNRIGNKEGVDDRRDIEEYKVVYSTGIRFLDLRGRETRTDTVGMLKRIFRRANSGVKLAIRRMYDLGVIVDAHLVNFPKTCPLTIPHSSSLLEENGRWRAKYFTFQKKILKYFSNAIGMKVYLFDFELHTYIHIYRGFKRINREYNWSY